MAEEVETKPEDLDPMAVERLKIARLAAEMVEEGEAVFLGGGAVMLRLARFLVTKQRLTVVTNDLGIAVELAEAPYINVKVTGGNLTPGTFTLTGPEAIASIRGICFNRAFLAPAGADLKFGYAVSTLGEAQLLQAVMAATQETVALLEHTAFGRLALAPVAGLADIPTVVTVNPIPREYRAFYLEHRVKVFTAYEIAQPGIRREKK